MINTGTYINKYGYEEFKTEGAPYATLRTSIISQMTVKHAAEFVVWTYLESLPPTWKPRRSHITKHFNISDRTYDRYMAFLNNVGLIEYKQERLKDGSFGDSCIIVLDGSKFNILGTTHRSAKFGGAVKPQKDNDRTAKLGYPVQSSTSRITQALSSESPFSQNTVERSNGAYINTTIKNIKEKEKINNTDLFVPVSVFSDSVSVKNHLEQVLRNRSVEIPDDLVNQGVFYAFETNPEKSFDSVNKRINIFLKMVRENKWLIPQGYNGITTQSIREKDEAYEKQKAEEYKKDSQVLAYIKNGVSKFQGVEPEPVKSIPSNEPGRANPFFQLTPEERERVGDYKQYMKLFSKTISRENYFPNPQKRQEMLAAVKKYEDLTNANYQPMQVNAV